MLPLVAVTLASFLAGFVNAIAGGGGLVSVPALFGVFPRAHASAKILNTAANVGAIGVFAATGNVVWHLVGPMIVANVTGSLLGTHLALRHGSRFIRPVFVTVVAVLILKRGYARRLPLR